MGGGCYLYFHFTCLLTMSRSYDVIWPTCTRRKYVIINRHGTQPAVHKLIKHCHKINLQVLRFLLSKSLQPFSNMLKMNCKTNTCQKESVYNFFLTSCVFIMNISQFGQWISDKTLIQAFKTPQSITIVLFSNYRHPFLSSHMQVYTLLINIQTQYWCRTVI